MNILTWLQKDTVSARFNEDEKQRITAFVEENAAQPEAVNSMRTLVVWLVAFAKHTLKQTPGTGSPVDAELKQQNETLQKTIATLQGQNETLRNEVAEYKKDLDEAVNANKELFERLDDKRSSMSEYNQELTDEIARLQEENAELKENISAALEEVNTTTAKLVNVYSISVSDAEKPVIENCLQFLANYFKTEISVNDLFRMLLWQRLHAPGSDFPFSSLLTKSKNLLK